ncbi:MAG: anthranilate synthase component 1 [Acidimicrobiales bacterium]|jgi:anthranilate synthase component I
MTTSREEFRIMARDHRAVPVTSELLADLTTPVAILLRLAPDEPGFLLESVENGERWSRFSFVGRRSHATLIARGGKVEIIGSLPDTDLPLADGALAVIEALLERYRAPELPDLPPLIAGVVGYLGYDIVREVEHLPDVPLDDTGYPDAMLEVIGEMAVFDHWRQRVTLVSVALLPAEATGDEIDAAYDDAIARLEQLARDGARPIDEPMLDPPGEEQLPEVTSSLPGGLYQRAVEAAKEYILAGDIFQVVLSQRFEFELGADPVDVYRVLRQINPSPYMYLLRNPELTLVGCSPEPLVQVRSGRVISRPIAGTRKRGSTDEEDRLMAAELAEDPKEQAEHIMLVDLARNDLGRVVEYGSLSVEEMMTLERYSHVMHLTSQVEGDLREGKSIVDVLRATIPAGTVSGAPKVRAMEIIDELEPAKRGPYSGLVGYIDFSGNLDSAITIRTLVCGPERASIQAGAGVVADSIPDLEDKECWNKARALLAAIVPARRMTAARLAAQGETVKDR